MPGELSNQVLWVFLLIITLAMAAGLYARHAAAKRRRELWAWAQPNGLSFSPDKSYSLENEFPQFQCLHTGRDRYACNVIQGPWQGREVVCFDYHYVTGSGKNRRRHVFSAAIISSNAPLRPLLIRPEGLLDKITEFLGFDDIDFESAEYSRSFYVKSPDKRWAYDVLHARAMEFLLARPRFTIQFDSRCAIAYRASLFSAQDFDAACGVLCGLLDRLPEYLIKQQAGQQE